MRTTGGFDSGAAAGPPDEVDESPDLSGLGGLSPIDRFLARLEEMGHEVGSAGADYSSRCPAHDDQRPSLSFCELRGGRLLVRCHAGCSFDEIMVAAGLTASDAFPGPPNPRADRRAPSARAVDRPAPVPDAVVARWCELAEEYRSALATSPGCLARLAGRLGVGEAALLELEVGWKGSNPRRDERLGEWVDDGPAWTFPERDGSGRVTAIQRRFVDERLGKRLLAGGRRGLYIPSGWRRRPGPVFLPEGASDTAALTMAGLAAVGRPAAAGGVDALADLLGDDPRDLIVLGENDRKPDGRWPGREGAERAARELSLRLGRAVSMALPPGGRKDIREYLAMRRVEP